MKVLTEDEFSKAIAEIEVSKSARAEKMPDEKAALRQMFEAFTRLKELGWKEAIYCPKDGSMFSAIEAGSTGVHECSYSGEWPTGSWWVYDGDAWPARPILWRPRKETDPKVNYGPIFWGGDGATGDSHHE